MASILPANNLIENLFPKSDNFNLIAKTYDSLFFQLQKKVEYTLEENKLLSSDQANHLTVIILSEFFNTSPYDFSKAICVISAKYHPEVTTSNILSKAHDSLVDECQKDYPLDSIFDAEIEEYSAQMHKVLALHDMI